MASSIRFEKFNENYSLKLPLSPSSSSFIEAFPTTKIDELIVSEFEELLNRIDKNKRFLVKSGDSLYSTEVNNSISHISEVLLLSEKTRVLYLDYEQERIDKCFNTEKEYSKIVDLLKTGDILHLIKVSHIGKVGRGIHFSRSNDKIVYNAEFLDSLICRNGGTPVKVPLNPQLLSPKLDPSEEDLGITRQLLRKNLDLMFYPYLEQ